MEIKFSSEEIIKELEYEKDYLLDKFYNITEAESPGEMYDIAEDVLNQFGRKVAPQNQY